MSFFPIYRQRFEVVMLDGFPAYFPLGTLRDFKPQQPLSWPWQVFRLPPGVTFHPRKLRRPGQGKDLRIHKCRVLLHPTFIEPRELRFVRRKWTVVIDGRQVYKSYSLLKAVRELVLRWRRRYGCEVEYSYRGSVQQRRRANKDLIRLPETLKKRKLPRSHIPSIRLVNAKLP